MSLDTNVWLVMLVTAILSLGLISYNLIDNESCVPFAISAKGVTSNQDGVYEPGETIIFRTSLPEEKEITWVFGDNTARQKTVSVNMRHKFMKEGVFTVTAMLNGVCNNEIKVNIKKSKNSILSGDDAGAAAPQIFGNLAPVEGKSERYISDVIGNSYEWKILDKASFPTINDQYAFFTFPKPGLYVLQLTVDHDRRKRSQLEINVTENLAKSKGPKQQNVPVLIPYDVRPPKSDKQAEKQPEKAPEPEKLPEPVVEAPKKKIINIRNEIFQSKLEGVVQGQNDVHDFDAYLPDGGNTKVLINDEKSYKTFAQLCQEIGGKKKIVIESVQLMRAEDNMIQQIKVKYKKKGLFGL